MSLSKFYFNEDFILVENVDEYNLDWLLFFYDFPASICLLEKNSRKVTILLIRIR